MRIVVTANGADLEAPASPVFGRCPMYVFVDTETMTFEAVENPAINAAGSAGRRRWSPATWDLMPSTCSNPPTCPSISLAEGRCARR